jgi:hypothetical protein
MCNTQNVYISTFVNSLMQFEESSALYVSPVINFTIVGGLEWSNDRESYAGGSVATGRASHAGQVKSDGPD